MDLHVAVGDGRTSPSPKKNAAAYFASPAKSLSLRRLPRCSGAAGTAPQKRRRPSSRSPMRRRRTPLTCPEWRPHWGGSSSPGGGERVLVYGDYDADGVLGTAILVRALRAAGVRVRAVLADRFRGGYGLHAAALEPLLRGPEAATLVVTVDTGSTAGEAVRALRALGADVVVTDHHALDESPPPADVFVSPRLLPDGHHLSFLSGAGVAYLLARFSRRSTVRTRDSAAFRPPPFLPRAKFCSANSRRTRPWRPWPTSFPCWERTAPSCAAA